MNACLIDDWRRKVAYASVYFALTPSLIVAITFCYGPVALNTWGQFLTQPTVLALSHSLAIHWAFKDNIDIWCTLQMTAAFGLLFLLHAAAMSYACNQSDLPGFYHTLKSDATFSAPSSGLISVVALLARPYFGIVSVNPARRPEKTSILRMGVVTAIIASVVSFLKLVEYVHPEQFLLSQTVIGLIALTCLWTILPKHYRVDRHLLSLSILATLAILYAVGSSRWFEPIALAIYILVLSTLFMISRSMGYRLRPHVEPENQNNHELLASSVG